VEDEVQLRVAAQKVLERLGYPVYTAGDGRKALRLFHAHEASVALVITDLMMPELGGRGLYEALRAEGTRVPVVFTSGFVSADTREREGLDPSVPFLEKPWEMSDLVRIVRELAGPPPARGS
jgi:CheY-like chemotaxis protein